MDENRGKELNNKINEFFTDLPPKTLTSMQYNDLLPIFHRQKKIILFIYLTSQNRGLSGLKNILPVIMTSDLLSVILSLGDTSP